MSTVWDKLRALGAAAVYEHAETSGTVMLDTGGSGHNGTIDAGTQINQAAAELLGSRGPCWVLNAPEGGSVPGAAWMVPTVAGFTHVIFIRLTTVTANAVMAARSDVNAANNKVNKLWSMQLSGALGVITGRFFNVANTTAVTTSAAGVITTNTLIMLASSHGPSGTARIRKNGGTTVATAALAGTPAESATIPLTHGRDSSLSVGAFNGKHYGGAYFLSELSDATLDDIWAWAQASLIDGALVVPTTTAAINLAFLDSISVAAVVPLTQAAFTLDASVAVPEVTLQAVVPATTASVSIDSDIHASVAAVVPATTAAVTVDAGATSDWAEAVRDLGADVLWWPRFTDGPDAVTLWDGSGNSHHGTYVGTHSELPALVGDGFSVGWMIGDSTDGHADVPVDGWLDAATGPDEFSWFGWVERPDSLQSGTIARLISDTGQALQVVFSADGSLDITVTRAGGTTTLHTQYFSGAPSRLFIGLTWGTTRAKMYSNGVMITPSGGAVISQPPDWTSDPLRISDDLSTDSLRFTPVDDMILVDRVLSDAEVLALYLAGAVETITLAAVAPKTTMAVTVAPEARLSMAATAPKTTAAVTIVTSPGLRMEATVPATTAAINLDVAPDVTMAAVVPATTASFDTIVEVQVQVAAVVPAPVAAFGITTLRDITVQAAVPKTTAAITVQLGRQMVLQAVVPKTTAAVELAGEAYVTMAAVVPKTTASFALVFAPQTDTSNSVGGRRRSGIGVAEWTPPVTAIPAELDAGETHIYAQAFSTPTIIGAMPRYSVDMKWRQRLDNRLVIGNVDATYYRGVPTPFAGYGLTEPLMYGPTAITFPQIAAPFETPGEGTLSWLAVGKQVLYQRVDRDTGAVVKEDYVGVVVGYDADGPSLVVQVGGEAMGRAGLVNRQVPIWSSTQDIGRYMYSAFKDLGLRLTPYLGPTTGVRLQRFGGQSVLDYISELVARSWNRQGNRWTVMPDQDATTRGVYKMRRKDTTTIHATAYVDDARVRASLHRDASEEPNRIFGDGITPSGQHIRNGVYPGLRQSPPAPYPFLDNRDFGPGTEDADTDTGDGITLMIQRLIITKYMDQPDTPGGYDADVTRAIRKLQADAGDGATVINGVMDTDTWNALWDLAVTGYSLRWSHIEPMAQHSYVRPWRRSATGAIMGRNPRYQPSRLKVDRNIGFGSGYFGDQMREWTAAELGEADAKNWTGSLTIALGGLIRGEHNPGDAWTDADVLDARDLRPGWNLWLPLFDGGTLVHIAAVNVSGDGTVSVDVDTRARDAMEVWEVISRNRESRISPARAWQVASEARSSTLTKDSMGIWDEIGGELGDAVKLPANTWTVFPVVAGQEGQVRALVVRTSPFAEYVMAVFGDTIYASRLQRLIGNPLTHDGKLRWANEDIRDELRHVNLMLYVAGEKAAPCGYYPNAKKVEDDPDTPAEETGTNPLTGRWEDEAGFPYYTGKNPVLWVAVFADRATTIPAGRLMYNQLEAGV